MKPGYFGVTKHNVPKTAQQWQHGIRTAAGNKYMRKGYEDPEKYKQYLRQEHTKLVGTGKDTPLGAEQQKSVFSKAPNKPSYGGDSKNILGSKSTGGEYGKWNGDKATDDTPTDNVDVSPKKDSTKADTTPKWTGGKAAGQAGNKSPLSKKPRT